MAIGKNNVKEIDFVASDANDTIYIHAAYSIIDEAKRAQEVSSFYVIADGYREVAITMDNDPFTMLEKGYRKINAIGFLLDEESLS